MKLTLKFRSDVTYRNLLGALIGADQFHRAKGGSGLKIVNGVVGAKIPESDIELFKKTHCINREYGIVEDLGGIKNYNRGEVYEAVEDFASSAENMSMIITGLCVRFPKSIWENTFPGIPSLDYIVHECSDKLKRVIPD